jgi:bifunctional DNase/RNase
MSEKNPVLVEAVVDSIRISLTNAQRIVMLKQKDAERYLPIWIGPYEAESITIALQEIEVARPQTHDLIKNILTVMDARLMRIEITSLKEDVYYGRLIIEAEDKTFEIDSRPSDAIAMAARYHAPIQVTASMMEKVGIAPERDLLLDEFLEPPTSSGENGTPKAPGPESDTDRLSVFEEFLEGLEPDDEDSNPPEEPEPPDEDKTKN